MKLGIGRIVLLLILTCSLTALAGTGTAVNADNGTALSSANSLDATPTPQQINELDEATVLLVRDVIGWSTANEDILLSMPDVTLDIINSASLATTDLSGYTFIVIAGDQTADFNTNVNNSMTELGDYVDGGGWLQMHFGTNTHTPHLTLWDGTTYGDGTYFEQQNFLGPDGDDHPILAGMTEPFEGNYASHGYMTTYPDESLIITVTSTDQPTFLEYDYGQGKVVCSTSPLEFNYPTYGFGQALWNMMDWMVNRPPAGPVILTLTGTSTQVPPGGGTIMYDLTFESDLDITYPGVRYWTMVELPNGQIYGPLFQQMFTLTPFMNVNIIGLTQNIPMFAPPGTYTFFGYAGLQPGPFVEDSFDFTKTGTATSGVGGWASGGSVVPGDVEIPSSDSDASTYDTPTVTQVNELDEAHVLLVRDVNGWGTANQQILDMMPEVTYDLIMSSSLASTDLADYTFIIIAGDQSADFNQNVLDNMDNLEAYVNDGGWLYFHFGTNTHTPHLTLWDGTTYTADTPNEDFNYMGPDGDGHPILADMVSPYEGFWANHGSFTVYPDEALIIIEDSGGNPTTIEYDYGQGRVVGSTTPLEHAYLNDYSIGQSLWNTIDYMANRPPAGPVILTLTGTSTEVPPGGGTIMYDLTFTSDLDITYPGVRYWTMVELPNGQMYGPLFQQMFTLTPFMNVNIIGLTQNIPMFAPPGTYTFYGYAGLQPGPFVEDSFDFTKTGTAAEGIDNWNAGGSFTIAGDEAEVVSALPSEFELQSVYPNPFNPVTTVGVALPQTADLNVSVFNVTGQKVADLASGQFSAGTHHLTFDGSGLTSGIYFVRAKVPGKLNAVEKITLLK